MMLRISVLKNLLLFGILSVTLVTLPFFIALSRLVDKIESCPARVRMNSASPSRRPVI